METFYNKSQIKFFEGTNLESLEKRVCSFMLTVRKIYNVKHIIEFSEEFSTIHYIMVSYE